MLAPPPGTPRPLGVPPGVGGRCDWTIPGIYIIQSRQWKAMQLIGSGDGVFDFTVGYTLETRAV